MENSAGSELRSTLQQESLKSALGLAGRELKSPISPGRGYLFPRGSQQEGLAKRYASTEYQLRKFPLPLGLLETGCNELWLLSYLSLYAPLGSGGVPLLSFLSTPPNLPVGPGVQQTISFGPG